MHPWSLAFLPDGRMLVTERPGRMRIVTRDGKLSPPLAGVPRVYAQGQAGLLDVMLDRDFAKNHTIYFCYAEPAEGGGAHRGRARPVEENGRGAAARRRDDHLPPARARLARHQYRLPHRAGARRQSVRHAWAIISPPPRLAQTLDNHIGKIVRIRPDGSAPPDNPFVGKPGALPEIWAYGLRNPEGLAFNPADGKLWEQEHGPKGGDEINIIEKGKNYGWPVVSYGVNYDGTPVGTGKPQHAGHAGAGLALDAVDRAVRHGVLHRRPVPRLERQPVQRRAEIRAAVAARSSRATRWSRKSACCTACTSASATCGKGRTARSICSPTTAPAASCA